MLPCDICGGDCTGKHGSNPCPGSTRINGARSARKLILGDPLANDLHVQPVKPPILDRLQQDNEDVARVATALREAQKINMPSPLDHYKPGVAEVYWREMAKAAICAGTRRMNNLAAPFHGTRKIADLPGGHCRHPSHRPPTHQVFENGIYEHVCPGCGHSTIFRVERPTL